MGEKRDRRKALDLIRLHLVVEGQTEETFVRVVLAPELGQYLIFADAHRITTGRKGGRAFRGGLLQYSHLRRDLDLWMRQDAGPDSWFSTMIDLYGLPSDFPGRQPASAIPDPIRRAELLEDQFMSDIQHPRFIPYIQVHEYEALLFADPSRILAVFPARVAEVARLRADRDSAASPEHIDDGQDTAPSKRIREAIPEYDKAAHGPVIAKLIGVEELRERCRHFRGWLERIKGCAS